MKYEWTLRTRHGTTPYPVYATQAQAEALKAKLGDDSLLVVSLKPEVPEPDPWEASRPARGRNRGHDAAWASWPRSDGNRHTPRRRSSE